ncbi:hypothetical protein LZ32DRAFT_57432 [Colletotrichum eremochloae]|nr:hypothetical protein LZ32DRAFT_57432 [Colletotrichum eremochloae]
MWEGLGEKENRKSTKAIGASTSVVFVVYGTEQQQKAVEVSAARQLRRLFGWRGWFGGFWFGTGLGWWGVHGDRRSTALLYFTRPTERGRKVDADGGEKEEAGNGGMYWYLGEHKATKAGNNERDEDGTEEESRRRGTR